MFWDLRLLTDVQQVVNDGVGSRSRLVRIGDGEGREVWWGADGSSCIREWMGPKVGPGQLRGMWARFAVRKSKYVPTRAGTHRLGHPGRSEFPVPVQSLTGSGVPGRGAERRDWVAEVGVSASKGFQG